MLKNLSIRAVRKMALLVFDFLIVANDRRSIREGRRKMN